MLKLFTWITTKHLWDVNKNERFEMRNKHQGWKVEMCQMLQNQFYFHVNALINEILKPKSSQSRALFSILLLPPTWISPLPLSFLLFPSPPFTVVQTRFVVDVQTYEAIFVGWVYTLTDGPSCRNVSPLLWDVMETPSQLLIQADWWQKETNRQTTLKSSLEDRTCTLIHR